jgi:hypothetical protein
LLLTGIDQQRPLSIREGRDLMGETAREVTPPRRNAADNRPPEVILVAASIPQEDASSTSSPRVRQTPLSVANIPSSVRSTPHEEIQIPREILESELDLDTLAPNRREAVGRSVDDGWREPTALLESVKALATSAPTNKWATEVIDRIRALGTAMSGGSDESVTILERLAQLDYQAPSLAAKLSDKPLARKLLKTGYALGRRIDVWQEVVRLGSPQHADATVAEVDPEKLALCLAEIDAMTTGSAEGKAWREYLLIEALKQSATRPPSSTDPTTQKIARQVLARLTEMPLTAHQQKFVTHGPVATLRGELRRWAAEPVGAAAVLRHIETFEHTCLPSDAHRLARDCQNLTVSSAEGRRQLADRIDLHYRNANVRIAITEELINRVIPEQNLEYALVDDTVLGHPVRGESLMATALAIRMSPDPSRVRLVLEVRGEIRAATTADAGPVRFQNDSESYYVARKPLEIDMKGITVWPVEVGVKNDTQLRAVETPLDWVPLIGASARWVAKSQAEQNRSAASQEVKQKIAAQARQRVDAEARERLTTFVARMNEHVFDPLNALSLDPRMIAAETTSKRLTMRLRLAGEDQLGSHTPRPQAPEDSLASVQLHESVLNNGIERLQLDGRTFSLPELSQHVADCLNHPAAWEINPEHADVRITFAEKDAVVVRCQDGRLLLTLSIAQLSKASRRWRNFQIQAFYRPEVNGRSAQLVRDGVIRLIGRVNTGSQIALRGIFSRALSKNNTWDLIPPTIVNEPKLSEAGITQFVIDDGWIGISMGPKPLASTARRPKWGVW